MKNILFLNHKQKQCGVYQYGYRSAMILSKSKEYNFIYHEVDNQSEVINIILSYKPNGIIYNYYPSTMSWINKTFIDNFKNITHYGIHHEGNETVQIGFDYYILNDPNAESINSPNFFSVPRPLFEDKNILYPIYPIPTIGSFGFGFYNKGFERLVKKVNEEFDTALIRLHIPFAHYGDIDGIQAKTISEKCRTYITKPNIHLKITHEFLSDDELLHFLAGNYINCFLYDEMIGRGISSVIDYALSVRKRIAITNTFMFRHICGTIPSICIEDNSLFEIMNRDGKELDQYCELWSNNNFIKKYEKIINETVK